jgi:hypothetical protein
MAESKPRFFWAYSDQYAGWYSCTHKRAIFGFKPEDRHEVLRMLPDRRIDFPKRPSSRIFHFGFLCAFVGPEDKFNEWIKLPWWRRVISTFVGR